MTKTIAQRRREDRERKRLERQRKRDAGVPSATQVQNAVTEAVSFAILTADRRLIRTGRVPINAALIYAVAVDILSKRGAFDKQATRKAVRDALAPRDAHRLAGHLPSVSPDGAAFGYKIKPAPYVTRRQSP